MLSAIQSIEQDIRNGYGPREDETNTTRFMRALHFTSMGECVNLRDSLKMNCWDSGYELAYRGESMRFTPHIKLALKAAERFGMAAVCHQEYVDGYRSGQSNRRIDREG